MRYAKRMKKLADTELLDLMQLADEPEIISFAGGFPSPELFPIEEIKKVSEKVLNADAYGALQYSSTIGYRPLRGKIAHRMQRTTYKNINENNVLITSGSQQALDMTGMLFLDEGDIVLCESPSYLGALNAFKAYEPEFVEVDTDDSGFVIEDLERKLVEYGDRIKLIYVIPDFQNPTGRSWSLDRRKQFLEAVESYDIPIVEDGAYSEIIYEGDKLPSLYSLDERDKVIYLGSFSKVFCPGFRVAWICGEKDIIKKYLNIKPNVDLSSSSIGQRYINQYLEDYDIDQHIKDLLEVYKDKRDLVFKILEEDFPDTISYKKPKGGLFFWLELPEDKSAKDLLLLALKKNVAFVPGGSFFPNGGNLNKLRMNYSNMSKEDIREGLRRLKSTLEEFLNE